MSTVKITHTQDGEYQMTEIEGVGFVDVLLNVNEVSVDGQVFTDVEQVRFQE